MKNSIKFFIGFALVANFGVVSCISELSPEGYDRLLDDVSSSFNIPKEALTSFDAAKFPKEVITGKNFVDGMARLESKVAKRLNAFGSPISKETVKSIVADIGVVAYPFLNSIPTEQVGERLSLEEHQCIDRFVSFFKSYGSSNNVSSLAVQYDILQQECHAHSGSMFQKLNKAQDNIATLPEKDAEEFNAKITEIVDKNKSLVGYVVTIIRAYNASDTENAFNNSDY